MTPDELKSSLTAKGYVLTANGWQRPDCPAPETNTSTTTVEPQKQDAQGRPATELPHPKFQEQQAVDNQAPEREATETPPPDYVPGVSGMDEEGHREFRITVDLLVSDRHRRDPTGALETICDVLVATRRRLLQRLTGGDVESPKGKPRRRRRDNRNNPDYLNPPF